MSYKGTVKNGVVVLEPGTALPEGARVRVEVAVQPERALPKTTMAPGDDPLFDMGKYAVKTGIPDLSVNADHYLYGHPKASDGK
jgi:hypothetical protein